MSIIKEIKSRQILDSRGNPTLETDVILEDGSLGRASVPSGASTGSQEAHELRDNGEIYGGKGVITAMRNVLDTIQPTLIGMNATRQSDIDKLMIALDGTANKAKLGANAILSVSLATAKATAISQKIPLYRYIANLSETKTPSLPLPMFNIQNGGAHADFSTDIQEYMIIPVGATTIAQAIQVSTEVFHSLGKILHDKGYATTVGDEGGYAPKVKSGNTEPLDLIMKAIEKAGYSPKKDIAIALDVASTEFYRDKGYHMISEPRDLSSQTMVNWLSRLSEKYPIVSIEDGCSEQDWDGWKQLTTRLGAKIQLVGDDLLVTNTELLKRAIDEKSANAILIKPNQIGSLSETIEAVKLAKKAGWRTIMSHRSGETEDTTIAHLAVGLDCGQLKSGSTSRSERTAKYNELLRIAEHEPSLSLAKPFA